MKLLQNNVLGGNKLNCFKVIFEQGNKFVVDWLKKILDYLLCTLTTALRQLQFHAFARVNPTTHLKSQANQQEIFPPKNQSFSSLIEIYLHLYHIWITWKTHIQRFMGFLPASLNLLRYTFPTLIYEQIYTMSTLSWISVKHKYTGVEKETSFSGVKINGPQQNFNPAQTNLALLKLKRRKISSTLILP